MAVSREVDAGGLLVVQNLKDNNWMRFIALSQCIALAVTAKHLVDMAEQTGGRGKERHETASVSKARCCRIAGVGVL